MNDSNKKKLLIYAHYYAPDVASTGQILQDLAEGMSDNFSVTVICTVPSYTGKIPAEYQENKLYKETINGVNILRVPVSSFSKTSKISRIKNLVQYFIRAKEAVKCCGVQDYILTISQPPILGGMLGISAKKKLNTIYGNNPKLIYCIQDFNPEQIEAVGYFKNKYIIDILRSIDMRSCRESDLVVTVGRDLVETLKKRFVKTSVPNYVMINNWIDEKQIYPLPLCHPKVSEFRKQYGLENKFVIMYSGNIGLYYDLEGLMPVIEKFKNIQTSDKRDVVFAFVGEGSVLGKLKTYCTEHEMRNVVFIPYQDKENLVYGLNSADVHWCVNAKGIKGVSCPSKFYGIAAVGKPILAVLEQGSEIELLIDEIGCGRCIEPGNYEKIGENIQWFINNADKEQLKEMGMKGYQYLTCYLTKNMSIQKYINKIESL